MVNTLKVPALVGTLGVVVAAGSSVLTIPLWGRLSDRVGRRPVFIGGAIFSALFILPFFMLLGTREPALIITAMGLAYGIGQGAMLGAQSAFLSELFPTRYRFTAIAARAKSMPWPSAEPPPSSPPPWSRPPEAAPGSSSPSS